MKHARLFQTAACAALFFAALPQRAVSSDQWLKTTIIDFSHPIRVPGKTLPPGKYTFKLVQSPAMQLQVNIFNEDQSHILATVNTNPIFRMTPPDKTTIVFYEAPVGQPEPIKAWLYPGDQYGREFVYSKSEAASLLASARVADSNVVASNVTPEPVPVQVESAKVVESVVETPALVTPAPVVAEPAPQPQAQESPAPVIDQPEQSAAVPEPTTMPATGSDLPLIGFIGLLSLGGAMALRVRNAS